MDRSQRRRARELERRLRELDRWDARYGVGGSPTRPEATQRRRRHRRGGGRSPALAAVVVALGAVLAFHPDPALVGLREQLGWRQDRSGTPVNASTTGAHRFLQLQHDGRTPVAYNPCKPIPLVVHGVPPEGGESVIEEGIATVSDATGLTFDYRGVTRREPTWSFGRRRSGPVVLSWTTAAQVPDLAGDIAGVAGSVVEERSGVRWYATGDVALDLETFTPLLRDHGTAGHAAARAVVMHELGHLVGLGHVENPRELMHAENSGLLGFGPGDLEGLAALGRGSCVG